MDLSDIVKICADSADCRDAYVATLLCADKAAKEMHTHVDFKDVMYLLAIVDKLMVPKVGEP